MLVALVVILVLLFRSDTCMRTLARYSPITIKPRSEKSLVDLDFNEKCLAGTGSPDESTHHQFGPRGACGLHQLVNNHMSAEITGGIGME